MIAAGVPDAHLAEELTRIFGYSQWPPLLEQIGHIVTTTLLILAVIFIIISRRKSGAMHFFRALSGFLMLYIAGMLFANIFQWINANNITILRGSQLGPAIEIIMGHIIPAQLAVAVGLFIFSVLLLVWPPKRQFREPTTLTGHGAR